MFFRVSAHKPSSCTPYLDHMELNPRQSIELQLHLTPSTHHVYLIISGFSMCCWWPRASVAERLSVIHLVNGGADSTQQHSRGGHRHCYFLSILPQRPFDEPEPSRILDERLCNSSAIGESTRLMPCDTLIARHASAHRAGHGRIHGGQVSLVSAAKSQLVAYRDVEGIQSASRFFSKHGKVSPHGIRYGRLC